MLYEDEEILKRTLKNSIKIIVKMLKENKLDEGLEQLKVLYDDVERKTLEEELFLNGMTKEESEYIVGRLASEWCKNYIMVYGFSKDVMINLQNSDQYKYIMK